MSDPSLDELQATLEREIPMCGQMGIRVHGCRAEGLQMTLPLSPNRNHQQTAFAGSLNALCTITGWGSVYTLIRGEGLPGDVVIRRSTIKYSRPVQSEPIVARCQPIDASARAHFLEMLREKGQAKIDLQVEIREADETAVEFHGSYVVLGEG